MGATPAIAPTPRWWPGRTRVIISGVLAALAVPLLICTAWMFVTILTTLPCHRAGHIGSDYCDDVGIAAAVFFLYGTIALVIGGSMITVAARLFLRPGLRGWVMFAMLALMIWTPIALFLVLKFIWIPLR